MCRTELRRWRSSFSTGMITETAGSAGCTAFDAAFGAFMAAFDAAFMAFITGNVTAYGGPQRVGARPTVLFVPSLNGSVPPLVGGLPVPPTRRRPQPSGSRPRPGGRPPAGRRPRPRPPIRWSTRIAGGMALLVITVSGIGHAVVNGVNGAINRVDAFGGMQGRPGGTKGTNFLLVGTDGRDGLDPEEKERYHLGGAPCHCTDTIMLVHLSADRQRASVVSIPRDSYVRLPALQATSSASPEAGTDGKAGSESTAGTGSAGADATAGTDAKAGTDATPAASVDPAATTRPAKINEAYADGGPKLTVRTVEQLTGVHIDHYVEVDFTSFMKTVDVIGGVQVCTTEPREPRHHREVVADQQQAGALGL